MLCTWHVDSDKARVQAIEAVEVGEEVLTHKGRWRQVTSKMRREEAELWGVSGFGILPTITTAEHPYYIARRDGDPEFVKVKDIGDESWSLVRLPEVKDDAHSVDWWWLAGRYLADGWTSVRKNRPHSNRVVIACNDDKLPELENRISLAGYHFSVSHERTCNKVQIAKNELYEELCMFGKYAHGKVVPGCVLELPRHKAMAFYEGYMSGDGRCDKEEATSVSPSLILGMALVAVRCGKNHPGVWVSKRPESATIEGRTVRQRDTYTFRVSCKSIKSHERDGYVYRRINRPVELFQHGTVYNISVDEDESYVANGAIVHNCQDFSIAGKRKGLDGDKSSLVREIFRLLDETSDRGLYRPGWLFYENVTGMLSSNKGFDFLAILLEMDKRGYDAEWQILDTQHFGVPQHRERVFTIGHLREKRAAKVFPIGNSEETTDDVQRQPVSNTLKSSHHVVGIYPTDVVRGGRPVILKVNGFHKE